MVYKKITYYPKRTISAIFPFHLKEKPLCVIIIMLFDLRGGIP